MGTEERLTGDRWTRRHSSSQALAVRSKIVLTCAQGDCTQGQIAADLGSNPVTVGKWRGRFAEGRLDGLVDAPRLGTARTIDDDVIEASA
ncbi:MAG: helix-turn-helix domain-containing protein [Acidimicrobiales bacterium]